jgi:replicative DNA helicase
MNKGEKKKIEDAIIGAILKSPDYLQYIHSAIDKNNLFTDNQSIYEKLLDLALYEKIDEAELWLKLKRLKFDYQSYIVESEKLGIGSLRLLQDYIIIWNDLDKQIKTEKFFTDVLVKINTPSQFDLNAIREDWESFYCSLDIKYTQEKDFNEGIPDYLAELEKEIAGNGNSLMSQKFPSINNLTGGLNEGNVLTISGAWKQGKTSFGLELILDYAFSQNVPIGIFSLEMNQKELYDKILSSKLKIPYEHLRNPKKLTGDEKQRLSKASQKFNTSNIFLCAKSLNEIKIKTKTKEWIKKKGVKCILIDYIGLIETSKKFNMREQEVAYLSKFIKNLASELSISVILLAQLNREGEKNPKSSNLAESISIARDSDFVFTIFKPYELGTKEVRINKNLIPLSEDHFMVRLSNSRHSKQGREFLLEMREGELREVETKFISAVA